MEQVDEVMTALTLRNLDQLSLNLVRNFGKASSFLVSFIFPAHPSS